MTIDVDAAAARDMLRELAERIAHPDPAFRLAENGMYRAVHDRFMRSGPGWVARKQEARYSWPKLLKTGALHDQVTGGGIHRRQYGPRRSQMEIGTELRYAAYQQDGTFDRSTSPNRKGIAPRPFLYYDEADMNLIEDIFVEYLCGV